MKYLFYLLISFSIFSCQSAPDTDPDISIVQPTVPLSKEAIAVKNSITEIETGDLETAGEKILSLQINGMEIIKISRQEYLIEVKNSQELNFKNYMQYLDRFEKTKSPLNNPAARAESQVKHKAVIKYLNQLIKEAPENGGVVHKVVYYLNATTNAHNYNQLKTTYLDENYKKMQISYLHLKSSM